VVAVLGERCGPAAWRGAPERRAARVAARARDSDSARRFVETILG
jgi:hypothetical protein